VLHSMTGFGAARHVGPGYTVAVELRSVNNRHLKLQVRGTEPYTTYEAEFDKLLRPSIRRGTVQLQVFVERTSAANLPAINVALLRAYKQQVIEACDGLDSYAVNSVLSSLLTLPGLVPEGRTTNAMPDDEWPGVQQAVTEAAAQLLASRQTEGQAMVTDLLTLHEAIRTELASAIELLPRVMNGYRARMLERLKLVVAEAGVTMEAAHLTRELAAHADRIDVSEEGTRVQAHLEQFTDLVNNGHADGAGRRLEFLVQEIGREVNTLGSKSADASMSRHVLEMKANLEKIRELIQNVE
jgi:uncharacterized protein (TIGR00255 family)